VRPGERVRARAAMPPGHNRLPGYVRGRVGVVHAVRGRFPFPDEVARAGWAEPAMLYSVCFLARDLWGAGEHRVFVDLFEGYLEPAP
jgi:nitrile hydratase subunit beta